MPAKASVSEASLYDRPRLPPVDGPVLPVELGAAADEAVVLGGACEVAKVVGTDANADDEGAPGKPQDECWKNPPGATLEVTMRLTASLVDIDGAAGVTLGAVVVAVVGAWPWPWPPAGGETVMVTHSVVYVVLVEVQESVAALAAAFTAPTLWTAPTAALFPPATGVLLAGGGMNVSVVATSEAGAAVLLAWSRGPSGNQPPVLLAFQVPPVG
jgi:hypothetical protein